MDKMDWAAAMDSEVFREYAKEWLRKDAHLEATKAEREHLEKERVAAAEAKIAESIEDFKKKVAENPALEAKLKQAKEYLEAHPDMKDKVDPNFVRGISLLNFDKAAEPEDVPPTVSFETIEVSEEGD